MKNINQLFLGFYASEPEKFRFRKGEVVLILQLSRLLMRKVSSEEAEDDFNFFSEVYCHAKRSPTMKTLVGEFFVMDPDDETFTDAFRLKIAPYVGR